MKGIIIHQGQQITAMTTGEEWKQGQSVRGTLTASAAMPLKIHLVYAAINDIRSKNSSKWHILNTFDCTTSPDWHFDLPNHAPLTDKTHSLYLLYGTETASDQMGLLQLNVARHPVIENVIQVFELFFRFKMIKFKNKNQEWVEYKLTPPQTKDYGNVDSFALQMQMNAEKELQIKYEITVKSLLMNQGQTEIQKKKKTFTQILEMSDYAMFGDMATPNNDRMQEKIKEILDPLKMKVLF